MLYYAAFGGGIYHKGGGFGLQRPALQWQLFRKTLSRDAAGFLAQHSVTKRQQLHMAANWPETTSCRSIAAEELKALKQFDSGISDLSSCTWNYVAGLFDAEGSISQMGKSSLRLGLTQKHSTVLEYVQKFLACDMGIEVTIYRSAGVNQIQVCANATCQQILEKLLEAGLTRKKRQAELALDFKPENAEHIRAALVSVNGNQKFGKSLDEAGLDRAQRIQHASKRANNAAKHGRHTEAASLLQQVKAMKLEHDIKNAEQENYDLYEYIYKIQGLWQDEFL